MYEVKVQQKREVAEKESAAELEHKASLAQSQKQFEASLHPPPALPPAARRCSILDFHGARTHTLTHSTQSTLHQKLMGNKANTYYSELKVRASRISV